MGQRSIASTSRFFACFLLLASLACDDRAPTPAPSAEQAGHAIASLSPAATDLIVAMGADNQLVAISNFDGNDSVQHLPRVGDYQTIDWERLSVARPDLLVIQMAPDRMPAGLTERAASLNIRLLNIRIDRLEDIFTALRQIGQATDQSPAAQALEQRIRGELDAVRAHVKDRPTVPTLIVRDESGSAVIGRDNFMDDLLTIAGGENVIPPGRHPYPTVDREMILQMKPQAILQVLPGAPPQILQEAAKFWRNMESVPAVKDGRVHVLTQWYIQQPGSRVGQVAQHFADALHPETAATTRPASEKAAH